MIAEAIRTFSEVAIEDLPQPQGYHILVKMRKVSEKIAEGSVLYAPESRVHDETLACPLAEVMIMGPECFKDEKLYPAGPRCKVGDVILMAPYAGQRILVGTDVQAEEYRIIPDAVVSAIVPKPGLVRRNM